MTHDPDMDDESFSIVQEIILIILKLQKNNFLYTYFRNKLPE